MSMELPPRCQDNCPLQFTDTSEHPVMIGRNCDGPTVRLDGDEYDTRIEVRRDGSASETEYQGAVASRYICRNTVLINSVNELVTKTKESEAL